MINEAIILAGGLGTRLREAVSELPKCLAPVADRPFLGFVIDYLRLQGIEHFIFSLGYKAGSIQGFLENDYPTLSYKIVIEEEPLGTGGAIQLAMRSAVSDHVLVTNGDTLFRVDVALLTLFHEANESECTLALKPMNNFDRYGVVQILDNGRITSFLEKKFYQEGLINGGVYVINRKFFLQDGFPQKFSFEKDYLEAFYKEKLFYGTSQDKYFIDIGIPEDFARANTELSPQQLSTKSITNEWTLFLDRDGVINNELPGNYVMKPDEFVFSEGVLEAFPVLSKKFGSIVIVSNQRGIGKGLMTEADLSDIHQFMTSDIRKARGRVDSIYHCADVDPKSINRKPNPGMAFQALSENPEIDFSRSIMVGNKLSDMKFGRACGMFTIFITSTNPEQVFPHPDIDLKFTSLLAFAKAL